VIALLPNYPLNTLEDAEACLRFAERLRRMYEDAGARGGLAFTPFQFRIEYGSQHQRDLPQLLEQGVRVRPYFPAEYQGIPLPAELMYQVEDASPSLPLATYLLFNYIGGLPRDLLESAFIDGASHFTIFTRLILPLSVPALASFAIFQFLWVWNDYLVALIFLGGDRNFQVVTMRLAAIVGDRGQDWHLLTAGAFVTMVLPLIVFFSLQRYFVRGLLAGSIKG
jgi:hypothetical protein